MIDAFALPDLPTLVTGSKKCWKCRITKSLDKFAKNVREKDGHDGRCKSCMNAYSKKRYKDNPISHHRKCMQSARRRAYGLVDSGYQKMLEDQRGLCAICGKPETRFSKRFNKMRELSVDHDHETGRIRGLLCDRCNNLLSRACDNMEILQAAITYLINGGIAREEVHVDWRARTAGLAAGLLC